MDPVDLIIASLDVRGAFPNAPWLLLETVWKHMGLPYYNFASDYIRTRKYAVRTGPGRGVPQGEAEGPSLYLLVKLPLALTIEQDYPAHTLYPLLSALVGFADGTNLRGHTPHKNPTPQTQDGQSPNKPTTYWTWPSPTSPATTSSSAPKNWWP